MRAPPSHWRAREYWDVFFYIFSAQAAPTEMDFSLSIIFSTYRLRQPTSPMLPPPPHKRNALFFHSSSFFFCFLFFFWILFMFICRDQSECMDLSNVWMLFTISFFFRFFIRKFFSLHTNWQRGVSAPFTFRGFVFHKIQLKLKKKEKKRVKRNETPSKMVKAYILVARSTYMKIHAVRCTTDNKMRKEQ